MWPPGVTLSDFFVLSPMKGEHFGTVVNIKETCIKSLNNLANDDGIDVGGQGFEAL